MFLLKTLNCHPLRGSEPTTRKKNKVCWLFLCRKGPCLRSTRIRRIWGKDDLGTLISVETVGYPRFIFINLVLKHVIIGQRHEYSQLLVYCFFVSIYFPRQRDFQEWRTIIYSGSDFKWSSFCKGQVKGKTLKIILPTVGKHPFLDCYIHVIWEIV